MAPIVRQINELEEKFQSFSDDRTARADGELEGGVG